MSPARVTAMAMVLGALLTLPVGASQGPETPVLRVYDKSTPGLVLPTPLSSPPVQYTADAMRAGLRGSVAVDVTVGADGKVRDVLLVTALDPDHGLNEEALRSASRWVFRPGTLNGQPVPVRARIDMHFSLK